MLRSIPLLRRWRRLLHYLWPHLPALGLAAFTMVFVAGIHLARPLILRELIDRALPGRDARLALRLGLLFVGAVGLGALALYARALLLARAATGIMLRLKEDLFRHLLGQEMRFFDTHQPGRLISRTESDVEQMRGFVSGAAAQLAANTLLLAGIVAMIWRQAPALGRGLMWGAVGGAVAIGLYTRFLRGFYREIRERDAELTARLTEFLQGVSLVRLFGKEEAAVERVTAATAARCELESRTALYDWVLFYGLFSFLAEIGSLAALLWYGTGEVFAGRLTVGTLVMFLELLRRFFGPLRDLTEVLLQLQSGLAASGRVFDLLERPAEPTALPLAEEAADGRFREIVFREVEFAYGEKPVLQGFSCSIRRGQRVAVIGASGSGKSTIINLLLRFYDPTGGAVLVDGRELRGIPPDAWRRRLALVQQEIHLFPGTVMDNLRAFDARVHEGRVRAAARELGADRFIERLPAGYGTVLAEHGANLSLGERQLLCYVRALVRNPELLILDEATSAVDAVTERRLQEAMERLTAGRTAVIIAHRLSTVVAADRILVLEQGRVTGDGTHAELVRRPGHYRELASLQGLVTGPPARRRQGRAPRRAKEIGR